MEQRKLKTFQFKFEIWKSSLKWAKYFLFRFEREAIFVIQLSSDCLHITNASGLFIFFFHKTLQNWLLDSYHKHNDKRIHLPEHFFFMLTFVACSGSGSDSDKSIKCFFKQFASSPRTTHIYELYDTCSVHQEQTAKRNSRKFIPVEVLFKFSYWKDLNSLNRLMHKLSHGDRTFCTHIFFCLIFTSLNIHEMWDSLLFDLNPTWRKINLV